MTNSVRSSTTLVQDKVYLSVRRFAFFVLAALIVALAYHLLLHVFGLPYPWDTFLFNPDFRFSDWYTSVYYAATGSPYYDTGLNDLPVGYRTSAYFPFAELTLALAGRFPRTGLALYALTAVALFGTGVWLFWKNHIQPQFSRALHAISNRKITIAWLLIIVVASYPFWFGFDRGNIDLWVGGLILIYLATLSGGRAGGAIVLGCAIALKGYPLALIVLGLSRRKYVESGLALLIAIGLTLVALDFFSGGVVHNWQGFRSGQTEFYNLYVIGSWSPNGTSDPFNGLRALTWILSHAYADFMAWRFAHTEPQGANMTSTIFSHYPSAILTEQQRVAIAYGYQALTTLLAVTSSLFILIVPAPLWRHITVACLVMILYPHVAGDYKLIVLVPAAFAILSDPSVERAKTQATWLLAFLLIPKSYLYLYGKSISMLVNPCLLLALWWVTVSDKSALRKGWLELRKHMTKLARLFSGAPAGG